MRILVVDDDAILVSLITDSLTSQRYIVDYLIKPIELGELNARIRALSRRGQVIPTTI